MEPDIRSVVEAQNAKLDAIYESVEKTRKYFLTAMWISIIMVVLPFVALLFAIPAFLNTYSTLEGLL